MKPAFKDIEAATTAVLAEPLYWFPVRHHSPTVARHVRNAMRERTPKVVFLEAPADCQSLVRHVVDAKTKPPVAIYSSYRDDDNTLGWAGVKTPSETVPARFAVWYPMLPYSPEYVVMKTAHELGIDVVFIDLPSHALIRAHRDDDVREPLAEDEAPPPPTPAAEGARSWEGLVSHSSFYAALAEAAGYRTFDEAWDAMFELGALHPDTESFRRDLAAFCAGVRATTPKQWLSSDGTLERERHMWQTIQRELKSRKLKPEQAMVVCGGFHLFLDRNDTTPPPPMPKGTLYSTVTPYSFLRTSELIGYGAGNRAPRYYQRVWEAGETPEPMSEAAVTHVVSVLTRGRRDAEGLSSADAIAVTQHAQMLAALRGRRQPVLDDVRDALISCCCKGRPEEEGAHLLTAMGVAEVGTAVGKVTPALGQLPLVNDFYGQLDALSLTEVMSKEKKLKVVVDLRDENDARRSAFLHRLASLEVPLAKLEERASEGTGTLFKERWSLSFSPKVEDALIEQTLYGDTIEAAALAKLEEAVAAEGANAGATCKRLLEAVSMDLSGLVLKLQHAAGVAIDADRQFISQSEALTHLLVLDRLSQGKTLQRELIAELVRRSFAHACFEIPEVASVPPEEQELVIAHLKALAEAVQGDSAGALDRTLFVENVKTAAVSSQLPFMQGAFGALLAELRVVDPKDLAQRVAAFARSRPEAMALAGEFLDGAFAVAQTSLLLGAGELVEAIDELVRTATWEQFVVLMPKVRHAFERLHARHRESFAARVAERYGLKDAATVATLQTSVGAALQLASLDQKVAEIMKEWTF